MSKATEDQLNLLHGLAVQRLLEEVAAEECSPAMMAQIRGILKDNDITTSIENNEGLTSLSEALREKRAKRKLRIVPGE
jgi:hypothetical protein